MQQTESQQRIKELDGWTDHYYDFIDHYYWRPNRIGLKKDKTTSKGWGPWLEKLRQYEPALNHMFDLFFHLAPQDLVDDAIGRLVGQPVDGMRLVKLDGLNPNVVQPDMVFFDGLQLVFVEMKVRSTSSVDQFVKYAIAAQHGANLANQFHLVMLVPEAKHEKVWKGKFRSKEDLRATALRGIDGDDSVWSRPKNAARTHMENLENRGLEGLREIVQSITLTLKDYSSLQQTLQAYLEAEDRNGTTQRLVEGMLRELCNRQDVNTSA